MCTLQLMYLDQGIITKTVQLSYSIWLPAPLQGSGIPCSPRASQFLM